ncbi:hypothetical protein [Sutcliffiella rhizosphaerae]|uniref:Uncharacterized protein n=1 Tax=Sutcliffiella rhizosphaerae TaxID=2880967 RepID=A0ABM8YK08_9BACI|nr:hypothetical protein [Sutcliffiella rhizosphaerae]CAG9620264.1 hypothetical protein BACCIP111883_01032 [Sutcliffiella rhizosphaerae]
MFKTPLTSIINQSINNKKKFLESTDIYKYAFKYEDKIYLHVDYLRFGKSVGGVILSEEGELVPKDEAIQPYIGFNHTITILML